MPTQYINSIKPIVNASALKVNPRWPMISDVTSTPIELPSCILPNRIFPIAKPMARTTKMRRIGFCSSKSTTSMFTGGFFCAGEKVKWSELYLNETK